MKINHFETVHWDNIKSDAKIWYNKYQNSELDETISGIPYDELSLMHYWANSTYNIDKTKPSLTSKVCIFNRSFSGFSGSEIFGFLMIYFNLRQVLQQIKLVKDNRLVMLINYF